MATYTKDGKTYTEAKEIADIPVLNLPAKGTSLKDANNAFKNCKKLKSVVIPSSITKIGKKAFYGCKKLKKITIKTKKLTAKKVGSKAFAKTHKKAVVKVPKKKWKAYKKFLYKKGISKRQK